MRLQVDVAVLGHIFVRTHASLAVEHTQMRVTLAHRTDVVVARLPGRETEERLRTVRDSQKSGEAHRQRGANHSASHTVSSATVCYGRVQLSNGCNILVRQRFLVALRWIAGARAQKRRWQSVIVVLRRLLNQPGIEIVVHDGFKIPSCAKECVRRDGL